MVRFGHYQLLRRIAVGGMAEIFLSRSASIDGFEKILIIKKIRPDLSDDPQFSSMFINEARIASALSHSNIVWVVDYGKLDDSHYMAMEYVGGCDLDTLLSLDPVAQRGLDQGLALYLAREICAGLDYAHNLADTDGTPFRIVHRDISPENILISYRGNVKITDFGIADAGGAIADGEKRAAFGKLPYMSPEQFRDEPTDRRTDVFATGLVLWEMLVGKSAYGIKVTRKTLAALHKTGIPKPSKANPWLPLEVDLLVDGAVALDPDHRYPTARHFADAITGVLRKDYPSAGPRAMAQFLEKHRDELKEIQRQQRKEADQRPMGPEAQALVETLEQEQRRLAVRRYQTEVRWSVAMNLTISEFREKPSLWTVVEMGRVVESEGDTGAALTFYRAAAVKFAQAGLFAQAMLCCKAMLGVQPTTEIYTEIGQFLSLRGEGDHKVEPKLKLDASPAGELLSRLLADTGPPPSADTPATPLLSDLDGKSFADLVVAAPLRHYDQGENIVAEGQRGATMHLIAEGRVLVFATAGDGQRVYLSALSAGDFFGENGFFTGAPRTATVQAVSLVRAFEIERGLYDRVMKANERANAILLRFYKDRIVDTLLAKSPTLGLLPREERLTLAARFNVRMFESGDLIIEEGTLTKQIYLIKNGTAEVFTTRDGEHTTLSEIGPGTIFGEVAALRNIARTASVRATTRLESLELDGAAFVQMVEAQPEIKAKILATGAQRARANIDKLSLFGPRR